MGKKYMGHLERAAFPDSSEMDPKAELYGTDFCGGGLRWDKRSCYVAQNGTHNHSLPTPAKCWDCRCLPHI